MEYDNGDSYISLSKHMANLALACAIVTGFVIQSSKIVYASEANLKKEIEVFYTNDGINNDFINTLDNHFCSGCGKHCPLIAPQCLIGRKNQRSALVHYEATNELSSSDRSLLIDNKHNMVMDILEIADDSMDYVMALGLVVGGVYYTSGQTKRKKRGLTHEK